MGMGGETKSETWATEDLKIDYTRAFTAANAMMASMPGFEKIIQEMKKVKGVVVYQTATTKMMGAEVTSTTELIEAARRTPLPATTTSPRGTKKSSRWAVKSGTLRLFRRYQLWRSPADSGW